MQLPISLPLIPSRRLALLLLGAHCGALIAASSVALPAWIKLLVLAGIVMSAWRSQQGLFGARRIVLLTLHDQGVLEFIRLNDEPGEARVHPHSTITPLLAVLLLRQKKRLGTLVLLPDSLTKEDFRRLRLWLRWQAAPG